MWSKRSLERDLEERKTALERGRQDQIAAAPSHREAGDLKDLRNERNAALRRRYSRPVDRAKGLVSDQTVLLATTHSLQHYPDALRRVCYGDGQTGQRLEFLTNNFTLSALTIAAIYRSRWQVELFFKWIKQHLRIKDFYGTSESAVKTQIWIAVSVYVLVAIVRKRLAIKSSLYSFLQILSLTLFEKMPILRAFEDIESQDLATENPKHLILFDF
jgi:IS4 transposase